MQRLEDSALLAIVDAVRMHGSQRKAAQALGIAQSKVSENIAEAKARGLVRDADGSVDAFEAIPHSLPAKGKKHVYILTCAQDYTKLHKPVWNNLLALADHDEARMIVSTMKYDKDSLGQARNAKWESRDAEIRALYPAEIIPYICDERMDLAPNLTWCGELNIIPTAERPLSGLESYTHRKSTIVPHPKLSLQSVPTMKGEGVKLMFTTGCVTQRNYIKRKVGYKAEHFHSYGALIVEVNDKGHWFVRQLQLGPDGCIYDKDRRVKDGKVTTGHRVHDICWGDVHAGRVDKEVADVSWGKRKDSMLETLRPHMQHVHDLLDFSGRSHHTRKDPHSVFKAHLNGEWVLTNELQGTASMLWDDISRAWCETYVVNANHDRHLNVFLKEMDWRDDPVNARLILALNLKMLDAIVKGEDHTLNIMEHALRLARHNDKTVTTTATMHHVRFLLEDESHVILPDIDGGIEAGLHGDRGANGAKGTIMGIGKLDRKVNGADKHQIAIHNHAYFCGTSGKLDQGWNHGLSSWTHAHTITYVNGCRAIYSVWKGAWHVP
jgi:hypothetical protein